MKRQPVCVVVLLLVFTCALQAETLAPVFGPPPPESSCGGASLPPGRGGGGSGGDSRPCNVPLQVGVSGNAEQTHKPNAPIAEAYDAEETQPGPSGGDPINIIMGSVLLEETDLAIPCPLLNLVFSRNYNSHLRYDRPVGHRWTHSYNWTVDEFTNITIKGVSGDWVLLRAVSDPWLGAYGGDFRWFHEEEDGSHTIRGDIGYRLVKEEDGEYVVKIPGGISYLFDTNGVLEKISHLAGPHITLTYTNDFPNHLLTRVEHSNGQYLDFEYNNDLIVQVSTTSTNVSVSFGYNDNGELVEAVRQTPRGDFTTTYSYAGSE